MNPLMQGDYLKTMKKIVGERLPSFTKRQSRHLQGSFHFVGLNHNYSTYAKDSSDNSKIALRDFTLDLFASMEFFSGTHCNSLFSLSFC